MTSRIRLVRAMLIGICFQALTGCVSGPTLAAAISQAPPIRAGLARVWFLRQFEPGESLATPIISANGVPVGESLPGTVFLRDFTPGTYTFTVPSYGVDFGQAATVQLAAGDADLSRSPIVAQLGGRRRRQRPARHSLCTGDFGVLGR
jgi:hypothetical protein